MSFTNRFWVEHSTGEGSPTEIQGALGYFELSKYDRQTWMRPVFVFLVDIEFSADRNIAWRETIVDPASHTLELGSTEGLGAWAG